MGDFKRDPGSACSDPVSNNAAQGSFSVPQIPSVT